MGEAQKYLKIKRNRISDKRNRPFNEYTSYKAFIYGLWGRIPLHEPLTTVRTGLMEHSKWTHNCINMRRVLDRWHSLYRKQVIMSTRTLGHKQKASIQAEAQRLKANGENICQEDLAEWAVKRLHLSFQPS